MFHWWIHRKIRSSQPSFLLSAMGDVHRWRAVQPNAGEGRGLKVAPEAEEDPRDILDRRSQNQTWGYDIAS